jgi:tetratricopeptide (TPR) repeat protein
MAIQRDKVIANAEKLVAKGKIEPAIKEYERLLDDNPNDVNTLNRIGDLWVRINRTDEAVKTFGRIADHYARDGFFLKAIAIYKKINKLDPSKLEVYGKLADLYAKQGPAIPTTRSASTARSPNSIRSRSTSTSNSPTFIRRSARPRKR